MKRITTIFALCLLLAACNSPEEAKSTTSQTNLTTGGVKDETGAKRVTVPAKGIAKNVNKEEFAELMESKNGVILDVRTPAEFNQGNIAGSINHDVMDNKFVAAIKELDRKTPVLVYCKSGGRSARAMGELQKHGFTEVYNLTGGYDGWQ